MRCSAESAIFAIQLQARKWRSTNVFPRAHQFARIFVRIFNSKFLHLNQSFSATFPLHLLYISHKSESLKANRRLLRFSCGKRVKSSPNIFPDFKSGDILKRFVCKLNPNDFLDRAINASTAASLTFSFFYTICSALWKNHIASSPVPPTRALRFHQRL